ncbi:putative Zein-binding domain-containing protein [Rosa chinensis]|uniref:Putative Zein-binding domain-containing protein n=1 Tax=Rosa chinensis TaxID=74649 RepID=A0A2P6QWK8_ROSCH|nr:myosin-binding protein 3 [Rosa chinensis]PRQ38560.1 putative Zein-binding domain-containing protein [Rosa chinensis]
MKMACQMIHSWTFSGLVGAFLDLAIAYLLLCASALAFFTSKFLDVFGLSLPCPCDGLFGNPKNNYCFQKQLVDGPSEKIGGVQLQLKSKYPFDVMWSEDPHFHAKSKSDHENGHFEFEGEASCSSYSDGKLLDVAGRGCSVSGNEMSFESGAVSLEKCFDHKGKKVGGRRQSHSLRRRRKGASLDYGKLFSVSSSDMVQSDSQDMAGPPYRNSKMGDEVTEVPVNSGRPSHGIHRRRKRHSVDYGKIFSVLPYDISDRRDIPTPPSSISKVGNDGSEVPSSSDGMEAPTDTGGPERVSHLELNEHVGKTKSIQNDASSVENLGCNEQEKPVYDGNDKTMVRVLEQALDEEHTARTALYYELEKERSAAATAADEAMAMILRLQEEKASIEMEARQYQRMIQEKSAYDDEEMNILKEILLRREREKHFLEKEVEYYRQILFGNDQVDDDMHDVAATQAQSISLHSSEELVSMQERTSYSISEKSKLKVANSSPDYGALSSDSQNRTLALGKELPVPDFEEDDTSKHVDMHLLPSTDSHSHILNSRYEISHEFQEKGMVSVDERPVSRGKEVQVVNAEGLELVEKTIPPNEQELALAGSNVNHGSKDLPNLTSNTEPRVHDIHVIDDKSDLYNEKSAEKSEQLVANATLDISEKHKSMTGLGTELKVHKVGSDSGLPIVDGSQGKALPYNMWRNSMSEVDYERSKIDSKLHRGGTDMAPNCMRRNSMSAIDYDRWKIDNKVDRGSSDTEPKDVRRNSMTAVDYERWKMANKSYRGSSDTSPSPSVMRRNSMSAVDNERCKLDNEVEWLRERLRIVQEGREKLNLSVGHRETEKVQLKLLEDIAGQLQEIRQLTEPGKVKCQAALPPPSSKVMSKKRRWRTLSLGVHRST